LKTFLILHLVGPNDSECVSRGLLHLAVLAPSYKIIKTLLDKGADPNYEDGNSATPLYMIFHPIEYKERKKYCDEKSIPKELLTWQDPTDPKTRPGRNDELVSIGQALLQGTGLKCFAQKYFFLFKNNSPGRIP